MIAMGGRRQPKTRGGIWPGQDEHGLYQAECTELANSIHWEPEDVCFWWSQIALVRERHNKEPRPIAEFLAMRDVREALDGRGREPC